jgi:hypothetical protein
MAHTEGQRPRIDDEGPGGSLYSAKRPLTFPFRPLGRLRATAYKPISRLSSRA